MFMEQRIKYLLVKLKVFEQGQNLDSLLETEITFILKNNSKWLRRVPWSLFFYSKKGIEYKRTSSCEKRNYQVRR